MDHRKQNLFILAGILISTSLIATHTYSSERKEPMALMQQSETLSADLVRYIPQPGASTAVLKVAGTQLTKQSEAGSDVEVGTVKFEVVEVVNSTVLRSGGKLEVPLKRFADPLIRARDPANQWNNLALRSDDLLLAICAVGEPLQRGSALAAVGVASATSPEVGAMRQCFTIEKFAGAPEQKQELIKQALGQKQDLLRYYALDYIGKRHGVPRPVAAHLIQQTISSTQVQPEIKPDLGAYLTRLEIFDSSKKADAANQAVVSALAQGLVLDNSPERRLDWIQYLGSCVLGEFSENSSKDQEIRLQLVRSVHQPSAAQVITALTDASTLGTKQEKEATKELLECWRESVGQKKP
jgi:hypothetical protein